MVSRRKVQEATLDFQAGFSRTISFQSDSGDLYIYIPKRPNMWHNAMNRQLPFLVRLEVTV